MKNAKHLFQNISKEWLEFHTIDIKFSTQQSYKFKVNRLNKDFYNVPINVLTTFKLQEYINSLYVEDRYAKSTIEKYKITLFQIFDYAVFKGILLNNPCKAVKIPKKATVTVRQEINEEQIKIVVKCVNKHKLGLYAYMMLFLGLRRSELLPLRWEDIDFNKKEVTINKVVIFKGNFPMIHKGLKNNDPERVIPLTDNLLRILINKKKVRGLLLDVDGNLYKCSEIDNLWKDYQKTIGFKMSQHQLRHTYATMLYNADVDIKTAQYLMGHRDITTLLKVYTHLEEKKKSRNISQLNDYISKNFS